MNEDNGFSESPAGAYGRAGQDSSLVRLFGSLIDSSAETIAHESEEFSNWLAREIDGRLSDVERRESERVAQEAALRAHARIRAVRTGESLPVQPLRARPAATVGNASEVARRASKSRCAPWVESLAVAAGTGREIWDEPCERWVELPQHLGGGDHLALTVAGDSMTPWLRSGDVILVSARKPVTLDCIVVARRADNGYVVKHVTRRDRGKLELSSFNKEYAPFEIERSPRAIIGVVVAKLVRDEGADL